MRISWADVHICLYILLHWLNFFCVCWSNMHAFQICANRIDIISSWHGGIVLLVIFVSSNCKRIGSSSCYWHTFWAGCKIPCMVGTLNNGALHPPWPIVCDCMDNTRKTLQSESYIYICMLVWFLPMPSDQTCLFFSLLETHLWNLFGSLRFS